jgi:hypothetical protein
MGWPSPKRRYALFTLVGIDALDLAGVRKPRPNPPALIPGQIRAAHAFLRWRAEDLARASAIGVATVRRAELAEDQTSMTTANDLAIRRALEAAGIEFIEQNGGGRAFD